jgi:hypothetical protein
MRTRRSSSQPRVVVKIVDPATGQSYSITVYGASSLKRVALQVEHDLNQHWTTTSLTDRRHKRRF